jgi:hypothetical protein
MSYQNINQYVFKRLYLKPLNEITDISLASDERDYDEEVIFSPLLIGENDGNRMPLNFDINSSDTINCINCGNFDSDVIVSENYWNPSGIDLLVCSAKTELCDVGLTGMDNGLVKRFSGETIELNTGLYTSTADKFSRYKYDRRFKMHPITGFTTTSDRIYNDDSYTYNLSIDNDANAVGNYIKFDGGFYQGFYKSFGYDYEVLPERFNLGWSSEFMLRYRWTGDTSVGLNERYPDNKGIFFYYGTRAENKFYHYANGSPITDSGYTRVTEGLNCLLTCGCSQTGYTASTTGLTTTTISGVGAGLTVGIEVSGTGVVTGVTISCEGSGYELGDIVQIVQPGSGGDAYLTIDGIGTTTNGVINYNTNTINVCLPSGTSACVLSSLVPTFSACTSGVSANSVTQLSGGTEIDFSSGSNVYTLTSQDGSVVNTWTVNVIINDPCNPCTTTGGGTQDLGEITTCYSGQVVGRIYLYTGNSFTDYDDLVIGTLRSRGISTYVDGNNPTWEVTGITDVTLDMTGAYSGVSKNPYLPFLVNATNKEGNSFSFETSFTSSDSKYLTKVLPKEPVPPVTKKVASLSKMISFF